MEFRPAGPSIREIAPVAFLGLLLALLCWQAFIRGIDVSALGLVGLAAMVAGGLWLLLRFRFPGSPVLIVDAGGLRYIRFVDEQALA